MDETTELLAPIETDDDAPTDEAADAIAETEIDEGADVDENAVAAELATLSRPRRRERQPDDRYERQKAAALVAAEAFLTAQKFEHERIEFIAFTPRGRHDAIFYAHLWTPDEHGAIAVTFSVMVPDLAAAGKESPSSP